MTENEGIVEVEDVQKRKESLRSVFGEPRKYQIEVFKAARDQNVIAVGSTGCGKTFISAMLMRYMFEEKKKVKLKKDIKMFFVVPTVTLVEQQSTYVEDYFEFCGITDIEISNYYGGKKRERFDIEYIEDGYWAAQVAKNNILVMTAQIALNLLSHGYIRMDLVDLIVFDECHHCRKNSPYLRIMKEYYFVEKRGRSRTPKIFGMSASPISVSLSDINRTLSEDDRNYETLLFQKKLARIQINLDSTVYVMGHRKKKSGNVVTYEPTGELLKYTNSPKVFIQSYDTRVTREHFKIHYIFEKTQRHYFNQGPQFDYIVSFLGDCISIMNETGIWGTYIYLLRVTSKLRRHDVHRTFVSHDRIRTDQSEIIHNVILQMLETLRTSSVSSLSESTVKLEQMTSKVRCLVDILRNYREKYPQFCALVFVKERKTAWILNEIINCISVLRIRSACVVGHGDRVKKRKGRKDTSHGRRNRYFSKVAQNNPIGGRDSNSNSNNVGKYESGITIRDGFVFGMSSTEQERTLSKFGKSIDIVVTTSVSEEGIDIQACHCVIRYSMFTDLRGFVQSKGRARKQNSDFVVLYNSDMPRHVDLVRNMQRVENNLIRSCFVSKQIQSLQKKRNNIKIKQTKQNLTRSPQTQHSNNNKNSEEDEDEEILVVGTTGARCSVSDAVSKLHHFCSLLPHSKYSRKTIIPQFTYTQIHGENKECKLPLLCCRIRFPSAFTIHHTMTGTPKRTEEEAKASACFEAVKYLYLHGHLNDHLLPTSTSHASTDTNNKNNSNNSSKISSRELKDFYNSHPSFSYGRFEYYKNIDSENRDEQLITQDIFRSANCLLDPWVTSTQYEKIYLYVYNFQIINKSKNINKNLRNGEFYPYGILCVSLFPSVPSIEIEIPNNINTDSKNSSGHGHGHGLGLKMVVGGRVTIDMRMRDLLVRFHRFLVSVVLRKEWRGFGRKNYLICSVDRRGGIDWRRMRECVSSIHIHNDKNKNNNNKNENDGLGLGSDLLFSLYSHRIYNKYNKHNKYNEIEEEEKVYPTSIFPFSKNKKMKMSYKQYMTNTYPSFFNPKNHPKREIDESQQLIKAQESRTIQNIFQFQKKNNIHINKYRNKYKNKNKIYYLLPQYTVTLPLSSTHIVTALSLPRILWVLENYLLLDDLNTRLSNSSSLRMDLSMLKRAMTASSTTELNYERLEFFGDRILKYLVSVDLFFRNPSHHEGRLSSSRFALCSNIYLMHKNIQNSIFRFAFTKIFSPRLWNPPGYEYTDRDLKKLGIRGNVNLPRKFLADVVESLLCCAYVSGGMEFSKYFLISLGVPVSLNPFRDYVSYSMECWHLLYDKYSLHRLEADVLLYSFENKSLLVQSLCHESFRFEDVRSYQRLEFLGDAILDVFITEYFYDTYSDASVSTLHDLRSKAASNEFFSLVCAEEGIFEFLMFSSDELQKDMKDYILRVKKSLEKITYERDRELLDDYELVPDAPKFLADIIESLAAAVYVDCGYSLERTEEVMMRFIKPYIRTFCTLTRLRKSPMRELTELLQDCQIKDFKFVMSKEQPQPDQEDGKAVSVCEFICEGVMMGRVTGSTDRYARMRVARQVLEYIEKNPDFLEISNSFSTIRMNQNEEEEEAKME